MGPVIRRLTQNHKIVKVILNIKLFTLIQIAYQYPLVFLDLLSILRRKLFPRGMKSRDRRIDDSNHQRHERVHILQCFHAWNKDFYYYVARGIDRVKLTIKNFFNSPNHLLYLLTDEQLLWICVACLPSFGYLYTSIFPLEASKQVDWNGDWECPSWELEIETFFEILCKHIPSK